MIMNVSDEIVIKYGELEKELKSKIDKKFEYYRRLISKSKWRGHFNTRSRRQTFGSWKL